MKKNQSLAKLEDTPSILAQLDKEIADLKFIQETSYKTSGNLEGFGNIKTETLLANLIRAASYVNAKSKAYEEAATWLDLKTYPVFEIGGGSAEDWRSDILLRKAVIQHTERLAKLNGFKEKMSKFLSEADQKAMLMKEMESYLNS